MIEIKPCSHCGSYPDIEVFRGGLLMEIFCASEECSNQKHNKTIKLSNKFCDEYNPAFKELIRRWNTGTANNTIEIKRCKYCGQYPDIEVYNGGHILLIFCHSIGCPFHNSEKLKLLRKFKDEYISGVEELIEHWNIAQS